MEQLTKQQITLLCLLVALFTSIATSVITASLFDQTSTGVTQTFYRVVEKTIQEVTQKEPTVTKVFNTKPDTVSETKDTEKQVPLETIVANINPSLVSISYKDRKGNSTFISNGVVIGNKNLVLVFDTNAFYEGSMYRVRLSDNTEVDMKKTDQTLLGMAILAYPEKTENPRALTGLQLGNLSQNNLGSNIIAIGQKETNNVVSTGIITEFPKGQDKTEVVTDIKLYNPLSGWVLLNTSGQIVGLIAGAQEGDTGARYVDVANLTKVASDFF